MNTKIKHGSGMVITVNVHGVPLSEEDKTFVQNLEGPFYCNDLTGELWMFDTPMPSGRWLENIHPANDLRTAKALVF